MTKNDVRTVVELHEQLPRLRAAGIVAVRLETTGPDPHVDRILLECPASRSDAAASALKSAMEEAANGILPDVPTVVEPVVSSSWAEK